jgi:glycogen(starch) synthase
MRQTTASVRRVLITTDAVGGVWTYTLELARAMPEVRFTAAVLGPEPEDGMRRDADDVANLRVVHIGGRLEWMDDPWDDVEIAAVPLLKLAEEVRPDVVHLNDYSSGALPWEAPVLVAGHSCVLSWWEAVKGEPAPEKYGEYRRRVTRGLRGADAVVAPSAWMLSELGRIYGPVPRPVVIHNGTGERAMERRARGALARPVVLCAGRLWDEAKNLSLLLRVAPLLDAEVRIAGDAGELGPVAGASRHLGVLPRRELLRQMADADIFVHPARYEPFGLAPLEAAVQGCALVLGDIPSLREVWGDAAVFVDPRDEHGLRCAIEALSDAGARARARWARAAWERAARYSRAALAAGYRGLYASLAARGRGLRGFEVARGTGEGL